MTNELGLRPGNLVYNVETLSEVLEVRTDAATIRNYDVTGQEQIANIYYSGLKGVPLSEGWLNKSGAEGNDQNFKLKDLNIAMQNGYWTDETSQTALKYVHELQNFYEDRFQQKLVL